jgi:hypothetical protein
VSNKTKLRPLVHSSYDYLLSKFYESEYGLINVSVESLQAIVDRVEAEAQKIGRIPDGLRYSIDEINYVLRRITELGVAGSFSGNDDIMIFGDALRHRFELFLKILDEMDADVR